MEHDTCKTNGSHSFSLSCTEEFELSLWVWTKNRHKKITSVAKFRYAVLESFVTNDQFCKSKGVRMEELPLIMLD
jgi:hypothetical protein